MLSIFDKGPCAPCPTPFNMAAYVLAHADATPHKCALSIVGTQATQNWRYDALKSAVLGTATGLLQSGLTRGDIVLMRLGNTVEYPIAYLGAIAAGLVPVPTSSQLSAIEVDKILETLKPKAILLGQGVPCPVSHDVMIIDDKSLESMRDLPPAEFDMGDPDRLAYIVYTSGTSGVSRAVGHGHRAIWARHMMFDGWYDLKSDDRVLHAGAFNWTYTMGTGLMDPWSTGATAIIPQEGTPPKDLPALMRDHKATIFAAAPGVYRKLLNGNAKIDLPNLRHGLSAGEKISDTIRHGWNMATGRAIYEAFGMSECSTFISGCPAVPATPGALGQPQIGRRVAIVGPDGPVAIGEEGVIAIDRRDPGLMIGYIGAPDETKSRMQGDWFLTGDHAQMDSQGQITYLGRRDDMMNAGGYRVSPLEVETALLSHPDIDEIGVTDIEIKQDARIIIALFVSQKPVAEDVLTAYAATRLARYKCPRAFVRVKALPRGANSKVLRRAMAPIYEAQK